MPAIGKVESSVVMMIPEWRFIHICRLLCSSKQQRVKASGRSAPQCHMCSWSQLTVVSIAWEDNLLQCTFNTITCLVVSDRRAPPLDTGTPNPDQLKERGVGANNCVVCN